MWTRIPYDLWAVILTRHCRTKPAVFTSQFGLLVFEFPVLFLKLVLMLLWLCPPVPFLSPASWVFRSACPLCFCQLVFVSCPEALPASLACVFVSVWISELVPTLELLLFCCLWAFWVCLCNSGLFVFCSGLFCWIISTFTSVSLVSQFGSFLCLLLGCIYFSLSCQKLKYVTR